MCGSKAPAMAVRLSWLRLAVRAWSATVKHMERVGSHTSWHACRIMSGLEASFPMFMAMVSRHDRAVYIWGDCLLGVAVYIVLHMTRAGSGPQLDSCAVEEGGWMHVMV